jgi:hypothetical protein
VDHIDHELERLEPRCQVDDLLAFVIEEVAAMTPQGLEEVHGAAFELGALPGEPGLHVRSLELRRRLHQRVVGRRRLDQSSLSPWQTSFHHPVRQHALGGNCPVHRGRGLCVAEASLSAERDHLDNELITGLHQATEPHSVDAHEMR